MRDAPAISIVLASASPRRSALLSAAGVPHQRRVPCVDDASLSLPLAGASLVEALAHCKAHQVHCGSAEVIVAADTLCFLDGVIVTKPVSEPDAREMLRTFVGRSHRVVTGVAIRVPHRTITFADAAEVWLDSLEDGELSDYLQGGCWKGKAGAYDYPERLAAGWKLRCEGDPRSVSGLPVERVLEALREIGWRSPSPTALGAVAR
ncbi:MAG: Maf family protein [Planctomycetota bacterium]|nr:Maf family protein [Planctomycetota bacterium]